MASDEEAKSNSDENFEWNVENEIHLFEAMIGHKPVGINKHFHMACISEKFESLIGKPVSSDVIWKHLESMFDLAALDKKESLPFPNDQEEFSLPESEYIDLINEKIALKTEPLNEVKEIIKETKPAPKVVKDPTPAKDLGNKKDKKTDAEESEGSNDTDKKEKSESESEGKRSKPNKEEKTVKTRAKRNTKEKKSEEEAPQTPVSVNKKEEETPPVTGSGKKEKQVVGKRNLRSRAEDAVANKSVTPPPVKRARRI